MPPAPPIAAAQGHLVCHGQIPVVGPCLGDIIGCMLCVMTCMASFGVSVSTASSHSRPLTRSERGRCCSQLVVMAIAWIVVRPLLAIGLLIVAAALGAAAFWTHQNKRSGQSGGKAENPEEVTAAAAVPVATAVPVANPVATADAVEAEVRNFD